MHTFQSMRFIYHIFIQFYVEGLFVETNTILGSPAKVHELNFKDKLVLTLNDLLSGTELHLILPINISAALSSRPPL